MGLSVASSVQTPIWLVILIGGLLALVFQLVSVGWFYRLRGLPIWAAFMQDILCVTLVLSAVDDPIKGVLIALILLWLAIISGKYWYDWYKYGR